MKEVIAGSPPNCEVLLWALDRVHPALEGHSVGVGPGTRTELLNRLHNQASTSSEYIVLLDDDVEFVGGTLAEFVALVSSAGFDLAQPAHAIRSFRSYRFNRFRPGAIARQTSFVEIGPVVGVSRLMVPRVFPLPESMGMGWGLDIQWSDFETEGAQLGVVDAVLIRHLNQFGVDYPTEPELARRDAALLRRSVRNTEELQQTRNTWWPWQARSPWHR